MKTACFLLGRVWEEGGRQRKSAVWATCGRKMEAFCPCGTVIRMACVLVTVFYKKKTHDFIMSL